MSKSFNVVIATAGRPTLQRMVDSIAPQLEPQDYLTIIWDCVPFDLKLDTKATCLQIANPEPLGYWGHGSRTRWQNELPGEYLLNGDDDDMYADEAMEIIRHHCTEDKLYLFQYKYGDLKMPQTHQVMIGNVGTPCGVYTPIKDLPNWEFEYCGDGKFYVALSKRLPVEFIDKVIYRVRPGTSRVKVAGEYVD